jgi:hypothetical protein
MQGKAMRGASEERQKLRGGVLSAVGGVAAERVASAPVGNKLDSARAAPTVAVTPAARDSAVRSTTGQQKMAARAFGNALADSLARNRSTMQLSEVVASSANVSLLRARETSVAGCYVVAGATVVGIPTRLSLDTTAVGVDGSIGAASAPASGAAAAGATRRRAAESRPVAAPAPALVAVRPARALSAVDDAGASTRVIGAEWTLLPSGNVRVVLPGAPSLLSIELRRSGSDLEEVTLGAKDATRLTLRRVDCRR